MPKALVIAGSVLLALALLLTTAGALLVRNSFTDTSGTVKLRGLKSEATVYRDSWGVPHIYAENEEDLFFAQGYVQAQDRLWQMELHRRMGSGTLAEAFGEAMLDSDRFFRALGLRRCAAASYRSLNPAMQGVLQSYCRGINAFISVNRDHLPVEFTILGFKPADWEPADSLAVAELIAWELGKNWEVELTRGRLVQKLGEEKAGQLLAPYPQAGPLVIPPELTACTLGTEVATGLHQGSDCLGSNNWVVDGQKTVTGRPLLANDPHLAVMMPSIWYETGLHGAEFEVVGVSLPGCPLINIGRNRDISWGITNLPADTQDLFIEKLNPANTLQYEYRGEWKDLQVIEEVINVRGRGEPETLQVRVTRHGPLLDNVIRGLEQPLALQWAGFADSRLIESAYYLDKAGSWEQFRDALRSGRPAGDDIEQQRRGPRGHLPYRLPYGGEGRPELRGDGDVVEPRQRYIVGDAQAPFLREGEHPRRHLVVGGEDRRRPAVPVEQLPARLDAAIERVETGDDHVVSRRCAGLGHRAPVARGAPLHGEVVGMAGHEGDLPMSQLQQMARHRVRRLFVVGDDARHARGRHAGSDQRRRDPLVGQGREDRLVVAQRRREDQSVEARLVVERDDLAADVVAR